MTKTSKKHDNQNTIVLPGDNVTDRIPLSSKIGTGLRYDATSKQVYATLAGMLSIQNKNTFFIQSNLSRYRPHLEDRVVGIVEDRLGQDGNGGDYYRVNIGASHLAILSNLAFEGATKRNKPHLQVGQVVYARVSSLNEGLLEPSLSCLLGPHDAGMPRKDWMTSEGCYGELKGGNLIKISTGLARQLLKPGNVVLEELAFAKMKFEVAIGVNGFLWLNSTLPEFTVVIQNAIQNSQVMTEEQVRAMVKALIYTAKKKLKQDSDAMED